MATPESWQGEAERLSRYTAPSKPNRLPPMSLFAAIGYALMETEHVGGFASRAPYFLRELARAGYKVVERDD